MEPLIADHEKMMGKASLSKSLQDVEQVIRLVQDAKNQIHNSPTSTGITLARLQNPVKASFETVKKDLKEVNDAVNKYSKTLDKKFSKPLPNLPYGTRQEQSQLIGRAIGMHLLREGHFAVSSTFLAECEDTDPDHDMVSGNAPRQKLWDSTLDNLRSKDLHENFAEMYRILGEMRAHNLEPATEWARKHRAELEARDSNLEFELARLSYIWLFGDHDAGSHAGNVRERQINALTYARKNLVQFKGRYVQEVQRLVGAVAYCRWLDGSPYRRFFKSESTWEELSMSFAREFCSLMGLSADSPVYIAATAGTIALPKLLKLQTIMETKHTEWTSQGELPVEIPLPQQYRFHSIFVCPVSKEQSTDDNPPMMLPCGHVIAFESLNRISKVSKFKCPYCPNESQPREARKIIL